MSQRDLITIHYNNKIYKVRRNKGALPFVLWSKKEVLKAIRQGLPKPIIKIKPLITKL